MLSQRHECDTLRDTLCDGDELCSSDERDGCGERARCDALCVRAHRMVTGASPEKVERLLRWLVDTRGARGRTHPALASLYPPGACPYVPSVAHPPCSLLHDGHMLSERFALDKARGWSRDAVGDCTPGLPPGMHPYLLPKAQRFASFAHCTRADSTRLIFMWR